tara:strand:+ start:202 stop:387 length:186 start_codon:yes stop_codon:yes gene_type:complete
MEPIKEQNESNKHIGVIDQGGDGMNDIPKAKKDLMSAFSKQRGSMTKKKPSVWRREAVWGI